MKLLTGTGRGQGGRDNDFNWCIEGELVLPPLLVCSTDKNDPDGGCGCGRGFGGLTSHRATTTATVRDIPDISRDDYVSAIRGSLEDQGWGGNGAEQIADDMLELASAFPCDAVIERRLDTIQVRQMVGRGEHGWIQ